MPWSFTFDDLAEFILQTLGWDCDHLYEFCIVQGGSTFRQQIKRSLKVLHYNLDAWDEDDFQSDIYLHELDQYLEPKEIVYFHFDFGDDHWFRIIIKEAKDTPFGPPQILKRFPKSFPQYPDWQDEDDEEY